MQMKKIIGVLAMVVGTTGVLHAQQSSLQPAQLSCEYQSRPLGIDMPHPRLSWMLTGMGRNLRQTAYEIIVSSSADKARALQGDVWESGKVLSGRTCISL